MMDKGQQYVAEGSKWAPFFLGEKLVPVFIPKDPLNPTKSRWFSINGQEIVLAVGEHLLVPASVAELWNTTCNADLTAEAMLEELVEIGQKQ